MASLTEIEQFTKFIVGDRCEQIDPIIQKYFTRLLDGYNTCFQVKTYLEEGCWLFFCAAISFFISSFVILKVCRNALNERLMKKEEQKLRLNPSNFNIDNQNLYTMFKLEYTLIEDFLIRTKLNFTRNIFNNEMKSILNPLIPLEDGELASLLGINLNELSNIRFKWNKSENSEDIICSTYLYHILNMHTKIMKIDSECQTGKEYEIGDELNMQNQNIENILKKLDDKYEKKIKEKNDFFATEQKYEKYKKELDSRYEIELKNEIERFKTVELSQMRIEENKKYLKRIEKLKEVYQDEFNKKYEEIKKLKNELQERETNLYKEFEERNQKLKKNYEEKEKILEEKRMFLEKKYNNEKNETSIQINKFNEELEDLKKSFYKKEKDNGRDIIAVFVADCSGSMDGEPMNQLKSSLSNAMSYINDNNYIGLVSYDSRVTIELPIAQFDLNQRSYFQGAIDNLYANGSTATYEAIVIAAKMIEQEKANHPDAKCMIILLSDGYANGSYSISDIQSAIQQSEIPIYTISYGDGADTSELQRVANINEAASISADSEDIVYKLKSLFNSQL